MKLLSRLILSSFVTLAFAGSSIAMADTTSNVTYSVQSGDTLWKISQKYNVSISEIASLNNITDINIISAGEVLNLPFVSYTVQTGDYLWKIAQKFNTTIPAITQQNKIVDPGTIYPGQVLLIPQSTASTAPASTARDVLANNIISSAESYLGVPYVWGGTSPSGFDCSGFTYYVFQQNGISLPRVSRDQFNVGTPVAVDQLENGDLVFFQDTWTTGISHVGIYIGNGQFIEESSGQGKVIISTMSNPYWSAHYAGARRDF